MGRTSWQVLLIVGAMVIGACSSGGSTDAAGTSTSTDPAATDPQDDASGDHDTAATVAEETAVDTSSGDEGDVEEIDAGEGHDAAEETAPDGDPGDEAEPDIDPELAAALAPVGEGDAGEEVEALQQRLADLGLAPGSVDGDYGRRTVASVEAFQELVGLAATGNADQATLDELIAYRFEGVVLRAGDEGRDVKALQERLAAGPFDPGTADGEYGGKTVQAVWALEKLAGIPVDGDWGPFDELAWQRLEAGTIGRPAMENDLRWVEVDLSEQLVKIYEPGSTTPTLVSHASSGSGIPWQNEEHSGSSVTPRGDFHIDRRIDGWRESSLGIGRLYKPLYFRGGIALHGSQSVPLYPASHGCIRLPMHIAEYLPGELPNGTPVHVLD